MHARTRAALVTATALAALAGGALAPAAAENASFPDPADVGGASLHDIRKVTLQHGEKRVRVVVKFTELEPTSDAGPASLAILIDTAPRRTGPEFRLVTGLQEGTDYQLLKIRDGKVVGDPLTCGHKVNLDFAGDRMVFRAVRSCLGTPARVRVGVKMTDQYDGSHPIIDWLGAPRSYTSWLASA